jgi:hypothetical protein
LLANLIFDEKEIKELMIICLEEKKYQDRISRDWPRLNNKHWD